MATKQTPKKTENAKKLTGGTAQRTITSHTPSGEPVQAVAEVTGPDTVVVTLADALWKQEVIPGCEEHIKDLGYIKKNRAKRLIISEPLGLNPEFSALTYLESLAKKEGVTPEDLAFQLITESPVYRRHVQAAWAARKESE